MFDHLELFPALERPDLTPPCITTLLQNWKGTTPATEVLVTPIDPAFAGSSEFCDHYQVPPELGANCVVVEAVRASSRLLAACVVPIYTRADLNKTVRKLLEARRVSFAPLDEVLQRTGMEYGGITPLGLPADIQLLIDSRLVTLDNLIVGGGYRKGKLLVPARFLTELPNAQLVESLGL